MYCTFGCNAWVCIILAFLRCFAAEALSEASGCGGIGQNYIRPSCHTVYLNITKLLYYYLTVLLFYDVACLSPASQLFIEATCLLPRIISLSKSCLVRSMPKYLLMLASPDHPISSTPPAFLAESDLLSSSPSESIFETSSADIV